VSVKVLIVSTMLSIVILELWSHYMYGQKMHLGIVGGVCVLLTLVCAPFFGMHWYEYPTIWAMLMIGGVWALDRMTEV
jgi:hypothetical protein